MFTKCLRSKKKKTQLFTTPTNPPCRIKLNLRLHTKKVANGLCQGPTNTPWTQQNKQGVLGVGFRIFLKKNQRVREAKSARQSGFGCDDGRAKFMVQLMVVVNDGPFIKKFSVSRVVQCLVQYVMGRITLSARLVATRFIRVQFSVPGLVQCSCLVQCFCTLSYSL